MTPHPDAKSKFFYVICDEFPRPDSGRLVEIEGESGVSVCESDTGAWARRNDGENSGSATDIVLLKSIPVPAIHEDGCGLVSKKESTIGPQQNPGGTEQRKRSDRSGYCFPP